MLLSAFYKETEVGEVKEFAQPRSMHSLKDYIVRSPNMKEAPAFYYLQSGKITMDRRTNFNNAKAGRRKYLPLDMEGDKKYMYKIECAETSTLIKGSPLN